MPVMLAGSVLAARQTNGAAHMWGEISGGIVPWQLEVPLLPAVGNENGGSSGVESG